MQTLLMIFIDMNKSHNECRFLFEMYKLEEWIIVGECLHFHWKVQVSSGLSANIE